MDAINTILDILQNPKHARWIAPLLIVADVFLCGLIIWKIPYTEIDWVAYMQQVAQYISGERDYAKIEGDTGPLVYPGAHVFIYRILYAVTDKGRDIRTAQVIFGGLYLVTLGVVMACYRLAKAPPYIFPLLILSKRLHSIFLLRCFNDCWAVFFLWLAIYLYQKRLWTVGSFAYTTALGIKMSVLLILPAIGITLVQAIGRERAVTQALLIGQMQTLFGYPFLTKSTANYFGRAFQLSRAFLYKWTVNWRFISEETFLSPLFSRSLLSAHLGLLVLFAWTRWLAPTRSSFVRARRGLKDVVSFYLTRDDLHENELDQISRSINPTFVITTLLSANAIGMLCARSLHYQFYSWLCWSTPFLLWRSGVGPIGVYAVWAAQEWAWNVYPSTDASSMVTVGCLALQVAGVWWGTRDADVAKPKEGVKANGHGHAE
ncbi:mannosyltransferase [Rhizodiscina lignyota]|uniref:Dol-P-Man:Man(5)GlcNAc(2)-PP-Dol alpha-1,3-mannosyltransferase n=1 Tax=Rhizodiscina lignyota TaxID=1504668 RepID=A0A9P4IJR5_9PEZI|nr:mannosyltransferase [Rhizodiscina lignyota]